VSSGSSGSAVLEVGQLAHVDLLGELAPRRGVEVLVVAQPAAGQRPGALLRVECAFPQQHRQFGPLVGRARPQHPTHGHGNTLTCGFLDGEAANLEHRGERFVDGATMGHVFDCKSKTWFGANRGAASTKAVAADARGREPSWRRQVRSWRLR